MLSTSNHNARTYESVYTPYSHAISAVHAPHTTPYTRVVAYAPLTDSAATQSFVEPYTLSFYGLAALGGAAACGTTHAAFTPLDVTKCRMQTNPKIASFPDGMRDAIRVGKEAGESATTALYRGWGPTLVGYAMQGTCKYGFYEVFKHQYSEILGEERRRNIMPLVHGAASASAELIADVALCPMESVKVRMQTDASYADCRSMSEATSRLYVNEGIGGFYRSLIPLWARQVPYTIIKFVSFEAIVAQIYARLPKERDEYNKAQQLGVAFLGGYMAGVLCTLVSHPADTMVSKITALEGMSAVAGIRHVYGEIGFGGLWRGLGARILMIGSLTALQWLIYDSFKVAVGLPPTGSASAPPKDTA